MAGPIIKVTRGDDFEIPLKFWADAAKTTPIDLTDCTVYFTVKKKFDESTDDATAIFKKTLTNPDHTDAEEGETLVVGVPADTKAYPPKEYVYDLQLKDAGGKVKTFAKNTFVLEEEITNRA